MPELTPPQIEEAQEDGAVVLDTRSPEAFGEKHIAGAVHIDLEGRFAPWVGTVVPLDAPVIVFAEPGRREEALVRLARVGYERAIGAYTQPLSAWELAGGHVEETPQVTAEALKREIDAGERQNILDVRTPSEWEDGHIEGARHLPLERLQEEFTALNRDEPLTVMCGSGYRSSIACSIMQREGFRNLRNLVGGWTAWKEVA